MNEFDIKAAAWDTNPMHLERSRAIVNELVHQIPVSEEMTAVEYGAGTGITSFLLKDSLKEITMIDSSAEMVKIMESKIISSGVKNMRALFFDLEKEQWTGGKFELLITQMVMHHVADTENILRKFSNIVNPGGYIAIADLYPEDGSFHGEGFTGHKGFDVESLASMVSNTGFANIKHRKCFIINKKVSENITKNFDVFLLTGEKQ